MTGCRTIGVFPGSALTSRPRLFDGLKAALSIELVDGTTRPPGDISAALVFDEPEAGRTGDASALANELAERGLHCLLAGPAEGRRGGGLDVRFSSPSLLDDRLRGRVLHEDGEAGVPPVPVGVGDIIVAAGPAGPLWVTRRVGAGLVHHVVRSPDELAPGDRLKDHLRAGRFLALLPVVHLLREALVGSGWSPPPLRASFIIDDPNLHWPTYGYLRYSELAVHVALHKYHLGIAMVPADAAFAHPAAVATFRSTRHLSLVVHGNDHRKFELAQPRSAEQALALAAQALRRTAAFERRHDIAVDRIMVPPHARCSEQMMQTVRRVGFEATCFGGEAQDRGSPVLAGWEPADTEEGEGLPRIRRLGLNRPTDEIVLRAFLDQPIILSGHHGDLADLDRLSDAASFVESMGHVQWMSLADVSRSNLAGRRVGETLHVKAFSRRMTVDLPEGVEQVVIDASRHPWSAHDRVQILGGGRTEDRASVRGARGEPLPTRGPGRVDISLSRSGDVDPETFPPPPWRPWPVLRRCMAEGRDRTLPMLARPRSGSGR